MFTNNFRKLCSVYSASSFSLKYVFYDKTVTSSSRLYLHSCNFSCSPIIRDVSRVNITLEKEDGTRIAAKSEPGKNLRDVIASHTKEIGEGYGLCDGSLSCSTCHVILNKEDFDKIPNEPNDEENDILDLTPNCTDTSRLACAITITSELDGMKVKIPSYRKDARNIKTDED